MSNERSIAIGVAVAWANRAVGMLSGFVLTPILFRYISAKELGLWYLIAGSQPLLSLMGFGIAAVLTRHIAMAKGEAETPTTGPGPKFDLDEVVGTGRRLLRGAAVACCVVALTGGTVVGQYMKSRSLERSEAVGALAGGMADCQYAELETFTWNLALVAWCLYILGYTSTVWVSYLECLVVGTGRVGVSSGIQLTATLLNVVIGGAVAVAGGGLIGLACVNLALVLFQRVAFLWVIRTRYPDLRGLRGRFSGAYARRLLRTAGMTWLNILGTFVVMQSALYYVAAFASVEALPNYQAASNLAQIPNQLAISTTITSAAFISKAWRSQDQDTTRRLTLRAARFGLTLVAAGHGFLLVAGEEFFRVWLGPGRFIGYPILTALCAVWMLECAQYVMSYAGRATDDESYTIPVMISAVLAPVLILGFEPWYGLLAVPLGMLIAQTATVNWYAIYRTLVRMKIGWGDYLKQVVLPWACILLGVVTVGGAVVRVIHQEMDAGRVRDFAVVATGLTVGGLAVALVYRHVFLKFWPIQLPRRSPPAAAKG